MKKALWIIVLILAVASFSDHPLLKPYKDMLFEILSSKAENATQMQGSQTLRQVKRELLPQVRDLGAGQQAEIERVTADLATLREFYQSYCIDKQFNPQFYGESIDNICRVIDRHKLALDI